MFPIPMTVFNNLSSIRLMKDKYQQSFDFKFEFVSTNQVSKYINKMKSIVTRFRGRRTCKDY